MTGYLDALHFKCQSCGVALVPRKFPGGQRERIGRLRKRRFCSTECVDAARRRSWADPDGPPWREDENGCWIWTRTCNARGYGLVPHRRGDTPFAYGWVYEEMCGPVPDGMVIDHLCRVPACVNPAHLEPVTQAENTQRGLRAKLSPEAIAEIRRRAALDESRASLAREFGCSRANVSKIVLGRTWTPREEVHANAA